MISNRSSSQTLIETLVAIGIIAMALAAILALAFSNLTIGGKGSERITAIALVREGAEVIRNIRDSNWLDPNNYWPYGLDNGFYIVNYNSTTTIPADNSVISSCDNCRLYLTSDNLYTHNSSGNSSTPYRRLVTISDGDNTSEKKIIVEVYWTGHGGSHIVKLEERLTNWR